MNRALHNLLVLLVTTTALAISASAQQPCDKPCSQECGVPAYTGKDIDQKPRIHSKPEPKFSEAERNKYGRQFITLEALLCGSGKVTDVKVKDGVADGIDEKAVEAARLIKFTPGMKDGNPVSRFIILKYFIR